MDGPPGVLAKHPSLQVPRTSITQTPTRTPPIYELLRSASSFTSPASLTRRLNMAQMTTVHLSHLPPDLAVHVAFFEDLQNSRFLRQQLLDGNTEFEYAFLDARMVRQLCQLMRSRLILLGPVDQACPSRSFQGCQRHDQQPIEVTECPFRNCLCI